jgi:hypothetical protein
MLGQFLWGEWNWWWWRSHQGEEHRERGLGRVDLFLSAGHTVFGVMVPALKPTDPRKTKVESVLKNYAQEKANDSNTDGCHISILSESFCFSCD